MEMPLQECVWLWKEAFVDGKLAGVHDWAMAKKCFDEGIRQFKHIWKMESQ